jgi:hypothetical protein
VQFLLDAGPFDLNQIAVRQWGNEDYTHFMQLIGYSHSGYGELTSTPDDRWEQTSGEAEKLRSLL